jgi:hypothetical protein
MAAGTHTATTQVKHQKATASAATVEREVLIIGAPSVPTVTTAAYG